MAVEKSIMQAPMGLGSLAEQPLDVVIDNVEDTDDGGAVVTFGKPQPDAKKKSFGANLAENMSDDVLQSIAADLMGKLREDEISRRDWEQTYVKGMELLGLKYEERTTPWQGACGVSHPLLMEAAVKFQSETIMETFPTAGPVRAKIIGRETQEKKDSARRVEEDMNYRLTEEMPEYRPEHERMLIHLCLAGNAFKKVYFDPTLGRQVAMFVPTEDIVVPYGASSLESSERVTHRMRKTQNEVLQLQKSKFYREAMLPEPVVVMDEIEKIKAKDQGYEPFTDRRYQIVEMHVDYVLPGDSDEIARPYVITIERASQTVLAIYRNWLEDDKLKIKRNHFVHYGYIPGFGFYYFGLIHLIGGHTKTATSLLRQLVDAGTLANLPGGFKTKGMRIKGTDQLVAPGEWVDVDLPSGTVRDNILPLPYKEPSAVLLQLMDKIIEDGRRFAATADLKLSDLSAQAPVGTTLAILERTLKVMSAVQARIHYSMKQEFKLLAKIICDNTPASYEYEPDVGPRQAKRSDYNVVDVIPVSDPNTATMSQRVVQYQAALELSKTAPQLYDQTLLHREMLQTLGLKNVEKIVPSTEDMKPVDPITENMNVLMGKPVKAFMYQDHDAHLQVHLSALQDPKMMAMVGQNPQAQAIQGAAMAHVMEHVAYQYRREIEKQLGAALPPMPEQAEGNEEAEHILPPEIEVQLSQLAARAAAQLLQKDVAEAKAAEAAAQANDPLLQLQERDVKVKEEEVARKNRKDMLDAAAKADELRIREEEAKAKQRNDTLRIAVDTATKKDTLDQQRESDLRSATIDVLKAKDQLAQSDEHHQRQTSADMVKHHSSLAADLTKHQEQMAQKREQTAQQLQAKKQAAKKSPNKGSDK